MLCSIEYRVSSIKTRVSSYWISRKHRIRLFLILESRDSNFSNPRAGQFSSISRHQARLNPEVLQHRGTRDKQSWDRCLRPLTASIMNCWYNDSKSVNSACVELFGRGSDCHPCRQYLIDDWQTAAQLAPAVGSPCALCVCALLCLCLYQCSAMENRTASCQLFSRLVKHASRRQNSLNGDVCHGHYVQNDTDGRTVVDNDRNRATRRQ